MKKLKLNQTSFAGAEILSRAQLKKVMGGTGSDTIGTPGGDNGNPCANDACSGSAGTLVCQDGEGNQLIGNCNEYPPGQVQGSHNGCRTNDGPDYWC